MKRPVAGFTRIELLMAFFLFAILGIVAIPGLIDFRKGAKEAAMKGALGALRSALYAATKVIQERKPETAVRATFPTLLELRENAFSDAHPELKGKSIIEGGIPKNPWAKNPKKSEANLVVDCGPVKGTLKTEPEVQGLGWCYDEKSGQVWANSSHNGARLTENFY